VAVQPDESHVAEAPPLTGQLADALQQLEEQPEASFSKDQNEPPWDGLALTASDPGFPWAPLRSGLAAPEVAPPRANASTTRQMANLKSRAF